MVLVTKLAFQSGDRAILDRVTNDPKQFVEWKGAGCHGPHSDRSKQVSASQYRILQPGDQFPPWTYLMYIRQLETHGADQIAHEASLRGFPDDIHLEIEVEQGKSLGYRR